MTTSSTFKPEFEGHLEKCYFCDAVWGECICNFPCNVCNCDSEAPGFDFGGCFIVQPNVTECTRFFVDPTVYYGEAFTSRFRIRTIKAVQAI